MSLAPSEERILTEIENRLRKSDLGRAAMLALFSRRAFRRGQGPARERVSPWQARPSRADRLALLALVPMIVIAIGVVAAGAL